MALLLFDEELPVPEQTVRAAFTAAVDTLTVHGDDEPDTDPEQRLDGLANHIADAGLTVTLVPARARRIDEGIARLARARGHTWPRPSSLPSTRTPPRRPPHPRTPRWPRLPRPATGRCPWKTSATCSAR
ncbi:hypothetical protein ACIP8Z_05240 [Streptomyces sp. NPDC088553]|uniref:hypothetical protein n=1 Tax=Streptomyces sp. NPDC088553 TaxID=3365864 RepID=UPI0037FFC0C5